MALMRRRTFAIGVAGGAALVLFVAAIIGVLPLRAPPPAREAPSLIEIANQADGDKALAHVAFLADPERRGRFTGSIGYEEAARYVADQLGAYGVEPFGDRRTYFQFFPTPLVDLAHTPSLLRVSPGPAKFYRHRQDFTELTGRHAGGGAAHADLAYVGGGYRTASYSDYDGVDPRGKVVLIAGPGEGDRVKMALEAGAAAALIVGERGALVKPTYFPPEGPGSIPVLVVTRAVADELLAPSRKRVAELAAATEARQRANGGAPVAFDVGTSVRVQVPLAPLREVEALNVVGLLRASRPERAQRAIAVGAHLDAVGADPDGTVFPGANDNASGVAVMLEVARRLAANHHVLGHSVVFIAFGAHEVGIRGSQAYLDLMKAPPANADSLVAFVNLDVPGCCGPEVAVTEETGWLHQRLRAAAQDLGVPSALFRAESDQTNFLRRRVPSVMVARTQIGAIHTPDDALETIVPARLRDAARVVALAVLRLSLGD